MDLPQSLWKSDVLYIPATVAGAHADCLNQNGWMTDYLADSGSAGVIGGPSPPEAQEHFVKRFLNSVVRSQFVCSDPLDQQPEIREMVLEQLADGRLFLLDLAAGHGAGTLAILGLVCELRTVGRIPKLPVNVSITAIDYSMDALKYFEEMLARITPWLDRAGMTIDLTVAVCDLRIAALVNAKLEPFFDAAKTQKVRRFMCVISAIAGVGKEQLEQIHDSLKLAATQLAHPDRNSSWLWIEPPNKKSWHTKFADTIGLIFKKVAYSFLKSGTAYEIEPQAAIDGKAPERNFYWHDPHKNENVKSAVIVVQFRNDSSPPKQ